jgi:uncharacterized glyoxalase superfamily protein PhnB
MAKVNYIPEGRNTVTPFIVVREAAKAIDFYVKAFGAQEVFRMSGPDGKIMYAHIKIGDSSICISDESPQCGDVKSPQTLGAVSSSLYVYVQDTDAAHKRAIDAGCENKMPPTDMFWGDRFSSVKDPFGHQWSLATHVEDVSFEEMTKRQEAFCAQMAGARS